ncbi:MAG: hypothetical protein QOH16_3872 [Gaiellaceae bacterium]|nr:hypothetical protein [Gaiellaceae bacterium]
MDAQTEQTTPALDLLPKKAVSWPTAGVATVLLTFFAAIFGYGAFGLGLSWLEALALFGAGIVAALVMFGMSIYHYRRESHGRPPRA